MTKKRVLCNSCNHKRIHLYFDSFYSPIKKSISCNFVKYEQYRNRVWRHLSHGMLCFVTTICGRLAKTTSLQSMQKMLLNVVSEYCKQVLSKNYSKVFPNFSWYLNSRSGSLDIWPIFSTKILQSKAY